MPVPSRTRPLALCLAALLALLPVPEEPRAGAAPAAAAEGRLLVPRSAGLWLRDLATGVEQPILRDGRMVFGAAWSPDGARIALAQFSRGPSGPVGTDLYLLEEGRARPVVLRADPADLLSHPTWTADGHALVYQVISPASGYRLELASLDGAERRTLEPDASGPTLSPDGGLLAYVRLLGSGDALVARPLSGGPEQTIVPPDRFMGLSSPRFSPDGRRLAFLAIGGPPSSRPARPASALSFQPSAFIPRVARAHGLPWDPWVVNLDGSALRRLADLAEDDPAVAWSPDGSTLAVLGGGGLWLVPVDDPGEPALLGPGSFGTFDWRP
jgi:Tol biopolymer transport system component